MKFDTPSTRTTAFVTTLSVSQKFSKCNRCSKYGFGSVGTEDSLTVDVDSEPVNVSGEFIQDIDRCDCEHCDNGGGDINQLDRCGGDHFRCDQCSVSKDSVLWICDRCRKMSAHKRHVKYMRLYTDYWFTDDGDDGEYELTVNN